MIIYLDVVYKVSYKLYNIIQSMKTCIKCRLTFPNDLISPMFVDGKYIILCAICANDMMNELTGQPKGTPFLGEQAQELHKLTLEYNKNRKVEDE